MTTIVMNTRTGAVSQYDWVFNSITATHAASTNGLYAFGGNLDVDAEIDARARSGKTLWGSTKLKIVQMVFLAVLGGEVGRLLVRDDTTEYSYEFPVDPHGVSRAKPGRGINANYLAFGFENVDGADFQLTRIEAEATASKTRRTN